jgi:quercetin dioxygenase-like cupin family protein
MKYLNFPEEPGLIAGAEHNPDLFMRWVRFEAGYTEPTFHNHPNTYEFYIVLSGRLVFENDKQEQVEVQPRSTVYFSEAEPHRIVKVDETTEMILVKRVGAEKSV